MLLYLEDGLSLRKGSEIPWSLRPLGRVGCRGSCYCFDVEIPLGNLGTCAHLFNELWVSGMDSFELNCLGSKLHYYCSSSRICGLEA
jgi:hypothetical protein